MRRRRVHANGPRHDPLQTTCEVCGVTASAKTHPCRFAKGCSCWRGEPCVAARRAGHRKNPPAGAVQMSRNVQRIRYRHVKSAGSVPYEHVFGAGVEMWGLSDGSVLLRHPTSRLHSEYTVGDNA